MDHALGEEQVVYKTILVPVDLDCPEAAAEYLDVARGLARANGATLTVISILPMLIGDAGDPAGGYRPELDAFLTRHGAASEINEIIEVGGSIFSEIRAAAERIGADLIVMGARNPEFTGALVGSNAAHVALHTPCSILLIQ
jgi:nucleotide-binding universal stress UspA family protein